MAILDEPEPPIPVQNINAETKTQYEQEAPQEHRHLQLSRWAILTFKYFFIQKFVEQYKSDNGSMTDVYFDCTRTM